jgi:hypothetical protein
MIASLSSLTLFHPGMSAMVAPRITSCYVSYPPGLVDEAHSVFGSGGMARRHGIALVGSLSRTLRSISAGSNGTAVADQDWQF